MALRRIALQRVGHTRNPGTRRRRAHTRVQSRTRSTYARDGVPSTVHTYIHELESWWAQVLYFVPDGRAVRGRHPR
eukprot:7315754-Prymnesium_polylepis.1